MTGARTEAKSQKVMYSFGYESRARALNCFAEMFYPSTLLTYGMQE